MNPNDHENIIFLFNEGDKKAFEYIYNRFSTGLLVYTKHFTENREEAEDIVTETFFKLWTLRGKFSSIEKLISFLHITAKNSSIDRLRHRKMQVVKNDKIHQTLLKNYEDVNAMDSLTEGLLDRIFLEIEKLPPKSREVVKMFYLEEMKNPDIAKRLGTNEKTVRNQKVNALKRLRITIFTGVTK
jgi:RNA polymerase sigma-70 factor (ECF subfamily)